MWPYIVVWAVPAAASFVFLRPRTPIAIWPIASAVLVLVLTLYIGLRYQVGGDWKPYNLQLSEAAGMSLSRVLTSRDPIYYFLNWISSKLGLGIYGVNIVCGFIFSIGMVAFCRAQIYPWLTATAASPFLLFAVPLGYTRQSVSLGLFMLAIVAATQARKFSPYLLLIVSVAFHRSAVLLLPILATVTARHIYVRTVILTVLAGAAGIIALTEFDRVSQMYFEGDLVSRGAQMRLGMNALAAGFFLVLYKRMQFSRFERHLWMLMSLLAVAMFAAVLVFSGSTFLDRLGVYFLPMQVAVLARLPAAFKEKRILTATVALYSLAVLIIWLIYSDYSPWMVPYQNIMWPVRDNPVQLPSWIDGETPSVGN